MINGTNKIRFDLERNETIYFRSKDSSGNYSNISSIEIKIDKTAPNGNIDVVAEFVKDNEKYVNNNTVTINVTASDNFSEAADLKVAFINEDKIVINEDSSISVVNNEITWLDYESNKTWTSSAGDGYKIVYVLFKDEAGNQSVYLAK